MRFWIAPHLAFLVQWLRVLGVDVRLWVKGVTLDPEEEAIVQWGRYPLPQEDIPIKIITLLSSTKDALLKEFLHVTGQQPGLSQMFKRCLRCNSLLIALSPEEANNKWPDLPPYVFQTQKHFNWCDHCRQVFWAGTHVRNMIRTLNEWKVIPDRENSEDIL